jgi:hypothetical protein
LNNKFRKTLIILILTCFVVTLSLGFDGCFHPGFMWKIGNNFPETVTVYFNHQNMGKIPSSGSKVFWSAEIADGANLLVEFKARSGDLLFSKIYTSEERETIAVNLKGSIYWIGPETK